ISHIKRDLVWDRFTGNVDGRIIAVDKEITLIQASFETGKNFIRQQLRSELSNLELKLTYNDIYEIEQPKITKKLDWFSR
ncbi:MAG TPA: hypothetical protein K8V13_15045, partial [Enterobacter roggenkampii]|nr:hypothetical protein [Enterobacter roggenkampii]